MMRANPSTSMQKTYDECFLTCSTAVYFEGQNNEAEALRSWKSALDNIYYHNAFRMPSNYRPRSETERALYDSLKQLELQCKERVDLLETLKKSRADAAKDALAPNTAAPPPPPPPPPHGVPKAVPAAASDQSASSWLGAGTVPPIDYADIYRPQLPHRPALQPRKSSGADPAQPTSVAQPPPRPSLSPAPVNTRRDSRTPSPDKKSRMLRTLRPGGRDNKAPSTKMPGSLRPNPPAAAKAATLAWPVAANSSTTSINRLPHSGNAASKELPLSSHTLPPPPEPTSPGTTLESAPSASAPPPFYFRTSHSSTASPSTTPQPLEQRDDDAPRKTSLPRKELPTPPLNSLPKLRQGTGPGLLPYRSEYPVAGGAAQASPSGRRTSGPGLSKQGPSNKPSKPTSTRRPSLPNHSRVRKGRPDLPPEDTAGDGAGKAENQRRAPGRQTSRATEPAVSIPSPSASLSDDEETSISNHSADGWEQKRRTVMKSLPRGVDESAAKQILNEIIIQGDEVHWDDVAGLDIAKSALKETVVYPFLRPDLFMGLREPARGMLLFGPPGTGKTMLARAVATESRSTFFAISASSLTSKFLGESEKLVRALFALAKMLAPSIIFVDEIDSLLSSRSGSGEHEATRRIKTEFLIQWSDLAKAAAGREQTDKDKGDASRVLVLAATNLPWAIDEAARRRFVRRQYIPLPEHHVRKSQLKTLLSHQKYELDDVDMDRLVELTDGFSGSDITALAKDAAMGPLRSLGEKLLHMTMDEIRPIRFEDFKASLTTIRPSVSKQGLKEFEDWATEYGERGG